MDRITGAALKVGLMAAALGSVIMLALMVFQLFLPVRWNWYNALAFFVATFLLAAARYVHTRMCTTPAEAAA
jgi:hypothetical protein